MSRHMWQEDWGQWELQLAQFLVKLVQAGFAFVVLGHEGPEESKGYHCHCCCPLIHCLDQNFLHQSLRMCNVATMDILEMADTVEWDGEVVAVE